MLIDLDDGKFKLSLRKKLNPIVIPMDVTESGITKWDSNGQFMNA